MDFLDFNNDGKVDAGEQFIGYQIFKDMNKEKSDVHSKFRRPGKLDGFDVFIIILIAYEVLKLIASIIY